MNEAGILGSVLDGTAPGNTTIELRFRDSKHQAVADIINDLYSTGKEVDVCTVHDRLKKAGKDTRILSELLDASANQVLAPFSTEGNAAWSNSGSRLHVTRGDEIQISAISWLWQSWLPVGKLAIMAGPPGTGKTTIALNMAAVLTRGGVWPDGTQAEIGEVLIFSTEDDVSDTLAPRLAVAGADLSRCHFVNGVQLGEKSMPFCPSTDLPIMADFLALNPGIKFLIIDPIVIFVDGDSHKNTEVRHALQPVVDLAQRYDVAILGISHFSKGTSGKDPVERVTGSVAFSAVARIVIAAVKLADDPDGKRLFVRAKSNIGPDSGGFHYRLVEKELLGHLGVIASQVCWIGAVEGTARSLLAQAERCEGEEKSATDEAKGWLEDLLKGGPIKASDLEHEARQAGISNKALRRAKEKLGIKSKKSSFDGGWKWELPQATPRCPEDVQS